MRRLLLLVLCVAGSSCGVGTGSGGGDKENDALASVAAPVSGASWHLQSIGDTPVLSGTTVRLVFGDDNRLSGSGGCNRLSGAYRENGVSLYISSLASTRMACSMPAGVMEQERLVIQLLENAALIRRTAQSLRIESDAAGGPLLFAPAQTDAT